MALIFFIILVLFCALLGALLGRWDSSKDWHKRHTHKCGYHDKYIPVSGICPGCGEKDQKWTTSISRARFPFGWETKK